MWVCACVSVCVCVWLCVCVSDAIRAIGAMLLEHRSDVSHMTSWIGFSFRSVVLQVCSGGGPPGVFRGLNLQVSSGDRVIHGAAVRGV